MNHPTSAQCYEVARLLRTVADDHPLDMGNPFVSKHNVCGTYLCHGGAYYAAKKIVYTSGDFYGIGADEMAKDLGMNDAGELMIWAKRNPLLWLNYDGAEIFSDSRAFINSKHLNGAESISDIADHWEMVGDKIKETLES